jgi:hypothetical protein
VLEIEELTGSDGEGYSLLEHRPFGSFLVGDTWHPTLEEAKGQANFAWPGQVIEWKEISNS